MHICIWCNRNSTQTTFERKAHTFPKSLGGSRLCRNVCDDCNHYFGTAQNQKPAVEVVLKEILNISKYLLQYQIKSVPKNKRYKSEYFKLNWEKRQISTKPRYSFRKGFQESLGRQFKRGLYKVFLEERENQKQDANDTRFDFIRQFARYDLNELPIYVIKPKFQAVFFSSIDINTPEIRFTEHSDDLDKEFRVFEYPIMGHNFCIPTSTQFETLYIDYYRKHLKDSDHAVGTEILPIKYAEDIDFAFQFINESQQIISKLK